jgi:hypothetical protein
MANICANLNKKWKRSYLDNQGLGEGNPWKNLKYWDTFPLNYLLCYFHTFFVGDPDFIDILGMQEYYQRFSLGRDQDARTTLRWLRLDYVYLQKNSIKKSES